MAGDDELGLVPQEVANVLHSRGTFYPLGESAGRFVQNASGHVWGVADVRDRGVATFGGRRRSRMTYSGATRRSREYAETCGGA